ncbi:hypothetical protein Q604_UNBC06973G0001, partial [human gut metagenome]
LLESSKEGRNINRHYYTREEIKSAVKRPVVADLLALLSWRNQFSAFALDGTITVETPSEHDIKITRTDHSGDNIAILLANAKTRTFVITANGKTVLQNK